MSALLALLDLSAKALAALPPLFALLGAVALKTFSPGGDDEREDARLVERARAGDAAAVTQLIRKYQRRVYAFCLHIMRDAEEAEELTQEVFIKLCAGLAGYRGDAKFSTWLFQIAKNLCLNRLKYLKRRSYHAQLSIDAPGDDDGDAPRAEVADEGKDAEALAEDRELQEVLGDFIAELDDDVRAPFVMRDIEGMRYDEIAKALDLAEGTVKSRIHKARTGLRDRLGTYLDGGG